LAHDKGYGERDKMAEWIMTEIRANGGIAYIRKHAPLVFGIPARHPERLSGRGERTCHDTWQRRRLRLKEFR
jgi:hypothetical protein